MLALGVIGALVLVRAARSRAVQLVAARTHALEAAARVDAGAGRRAHVLVVALVHVDAGVALAREALGAGTRVAAGRVGALALAAVLARGALVQVHARRAVRGQDVALRAAARVAAVRVLARELARRRRLGALVHVWSKGTKTVEMVVVRTQCRAGRRRGRSTNRCSCCRCGPACSPCCTCTGTIPWC